MNENPYQAPLATETVELAEVSETEEPVSFNTKRQQAFRNCLISVLIFSVPAFINMVFLEGYYLWQLLIFFRDLTYPEIVFLVFVLCFWVGAALGCLKVLEKIAGIIRWAIARRTSKEEWMIILFESTQRLVPLCLAGFITWMMWNIGFYIYEIDFTAISAFCGTIGHILAAIWYLPLVIRWFRLWMTS